MIVVVDLLIRFLVGAAVGMVVGAVAGLVFVMAVSLIQRPKR